MLETHGDFKTVELKLERYRNLIQTRTAGGRWCTKKYLADVEHYSTSMIENSWRHAASKGLVRKNPVHGEEEAKLVLEESFSKKDEMGESQRLSQQGDFEDRGVCSHI